MERRRKRGALTRELIDSFRETFGFKASESACEKAGGLSKH